MDSHDSRPRIGRLLGEAYALWQERTYAGMAERGFPEIRPAHSPVFRLLKREGSRVSDLASAAAITKQSMAYLIESLQKLALVAVGPDPEDGRAKLVTFTARGFEAEATLAQLSRELEVDLAARIGSDALESLRQLLIVAGEQES